VRIIDVLAPYLIGAATTLAVQATIEFWVVPRVDIRKRREDRWERNVLDLGELPTSSTLAELAMRAQVEQGVYRQARAVAPSFDDPSYPDMVAAQASKARLATWAPTDLVRTRVDWLIDRFQAFKPNADEMADFQIARMRYQLRVSDIGMWDEDGERSEDKFEEDWRAERDARNKLIAQVKHLADMPRPPRISRLKICWRRIRRTARKWVHPQSSRTS
jgi:hypothetical protein